MAAQLGSFRYNFEQKGKQRLLSVNYGDLVSDDDDEEVGGCCRRLRGWVADEWRKAKGWAAVAWEFGRSDPRKVVFSAKVGLALVLISFLVFLKEPLKDLSKYSVWAILTVVLVFEFSVGIPLPSSTSAPE